jgi:hypothetical protein
MLGSREIVKIAHAKRYVSHGETDGQERIVDGAIRIARVRPADKRAGLDHLMIHDEA